MTSLQGISFSDYITLLREGERGRGREGEGDVWGVVSGRKPARDGEEEGESQGERDRRRRRGSEIERKN